MSFLDSSSTFRFLNLPPEVRRIIYHFCISSSTASEIEILLPFHDMQHDWRGKPRVETSREDGRHRRKIVYSLLLSCKEVYEEFQQL